MPDQGRAGLRQDLIEWLERERDARYQEMQLSGIPTSVPVNVPVVEHLDGGGLSMFHEQRQENPLMLLGGFSDGIRDQNPPSSALLKEYGDECFPWQWDSKAREDFHKNRESWVTSNLLSPTAQRYLFSLRRLDEGDIELATSLADGLLSLLEGDRIRVVALTPVAGISIESGSELTHDFATVRSLTPGELSELALIRGLPGSEHSFFWRKRGVGFFPDFASTFERHALVVSAECEKTTRPLLGRRSERLVLALQLLGHDLAGGGMTPYWFEPGPRRADSGTRVQLSKHSKSRALSPQVFQEAVDLSRRIPEDVFTPSQKAGHIALARFRSAVCEREPSESLIDYTIALEAVLLPGMAAELAFRLSLYGAALLEQPGEARSSVYKTLRAIYSARSDLVHGSHVDAKKLQDLRGRARELTSRILVAGLTDGWPTQESLEALLFQERSDLPPS